MERPPRPVRTVLDELATVEQYLLDAPPHAGAGDREHLIRRVAELRRELVAPRRDDDPPRGR